MSLIDPRAIIDPTAVLADGVEVGPWSIVGAGVENRRGDSHRAAGDSQGADANR